MKKVMILWNVLFFGLSYKAFAKAGIAEGGFEFMLTIVGFLLIVVVLFEGIEYLKNNGRNLFNRFKAFVNRKTNVHRNFV
jgi:hypothetical protein